MGWCKRLFEKSEEPLRRAITEIEEETGFTIENIKFLEEGKPLEADNMRPNNITWVVHPVGLGT